MRVGPGNPVEITVRLSSSPIALDPIQVAVRSPTLERTGFYERRDHGPQGTFFTQADIDRLAPTVLSDLVRRVPATRFMEGGPGRTILRFNRQYGAGGPLPGCEPAVFVDGVLIQDQTIEPRVLDFNRVPPSQIAAVEIYVGASMPMQYNRTSCGAVVNWTKRGS
jgi:outer membrane cobalamin receptor